MGSVLWSFGAFQGNIWSVAPFIPVGNLQKNTKQIISHVTNRAVLQRVFQSWLVWIRGTDWQAGLSTHPQDMETLPAELAPPGARKTTDLGEAWSKFSFLDPLRLVRHGIFNPPGLLVLVSSM